MEKESFLINTYRRYPVRFVKGRGATLWDEAGKEYIDFLAGIGVCNVGHCHPKVVEAIKRQSEALLHTSNLFHIAPQEEVAERLYHLTGMLSFFCNSGAEAVESAIKLARAYGKPKGRYKIISAFNSFHGRTMGALSATAQAKYQEKFLPLVPGFSYAIYNDLEGFLSLADDETCAVLLEPVQGEGGVYPAEEKFLRGIWEFCQEHDILLILDEVQTGLGRCGEMFCYENYHIKPHIMTLAKSLGGGVPIGAMLAVPEVAEAFSPGDHASTFGGNFLASSCALAVLNILEEEKLPQRAREYGKIFRGKLEELRGKFSFIEEVRGIGLMLALQFEQPLARQVVERGLEKGVVLNAIGEKILRLLPPLVITEEEMERGFKALEEAIEDVSRDI